MENLKAKKEELQEAIQQEEREKQQAFIQAYEALVKEHGVQLVAHVSIIGKEVQSNLVPISIV